MPFQGYNWSNAGDLGTALVQAPAANTGGSFWVAILYFIWVVALALMSVFGWEVAVLGSSFGAIVVGVFFLYFGGIAWGWLAPFVGIELFMFIYLIWSSRN